MPPFDVRWALRACLVVFLLALGFWSGHAWRDRSAHADLAECQRTHAEALAITLRAARQAEADHRAQEARTAQEQAHALAAAHESTLQARADAARVRAALDRLRRAAAAAPGGGDAAASAPAGPGSEAAGTAADLPPDLLWRLGEAAGELAAAADQARIAGIACQRSYEALSVPRLGDRP